MDYQCDKCKTWNYAHEGACTRCAEKGDDTEATKDQKMQAIVEAAGEKWNDVEYYTCGASDVRRCVSKANPSPTDLNELFRLAEKLGFNSINIHLRSSHCVAIKSYPRHNASGEVTVDGDSSEAIADTPAEALLEALYQAVKGRVMDRTRIPLGAKQCDCGVNIAITMTACKMCQIERLTAELAKKSDLYAGVKTLCEQQIEQNQRLKDDLNTVTEGKWTQTEIDAGLWRAYKAKQALEGESDGR